MRLVSPILKNAVYPALHRIGWLNHIMPPAGYAVVNYHGVVPSGYSDHEPFLDGNLVRPEVLRQQLQFLKTHYHIIHPEDFRACIEQDKPLPPRAVLVTCDDGLVNSLTDMLPVLQSENVSCIFFVTGASCGNDPGMLWYEELYHLMRLKPLGAADSQLPTEEGADYTSAKNPSSESFQARWWNAVRRASRLDAIARTQWIDLVRSNREVAWTFHSELRSEQSASERTVAEKAFSEKRWRLLSIDELNRLSEAGMSIGAHTISHPVLSLCGEEEARREVQESKTSLERALGQPVWAFAYPFGNPATMGEREVRLAREAGYACAFLNVEHWSDQPSNVFALPRTHVTSQTTLPEFAAHLSGLHARLQRAAGG